MLRTIQLDYQFCCVAIEVCNITADCFLTLESNRIASQKIIPKMVFLPCRIFAQFSCAWNQFMLVWQRHLAFPILSIVDSLHRLWVVLLFVRRYRLPSSAFADTSLSEGGMVPLKEGDVTFGDRGSYPKYSCINAFFSVSSFSRLSLMVVFVFSVRITKSENCCCKCNGGIIILKAFISPTLMWGDADPLTPLRAFLRNESKFIAELKNCGEHLVVSGDNSMDLCPSATLQSRSIIAAIPRIAPSRVYTISPFSGFFLWIL